MSASPAWVVEIESAARGLPVLLLEGAEDLMWFSHFLDIHKPGWRTRMSLAVADGKRRVIQAVTAHRSSWIGIVDRDEWREADIVAAADRTSRLHVLPRFCIESFLCDPDELWVALPDLQRRRVEGGLAAFSGRILEQLPAWVTHGAMWRVLRGVHATSRFPSELEDGPVADEANIRQILSRWHQQIAPDVVMDQYRIELERGRRLPQSDQLRHYVHGKKFFNQVVVQVLDSLFSGRGADDWQQKFRSAPLEPPPDWVQLFDRVLALLPQVEPL